MSFFTWNMFGANDSLDNKWNAHVKKRCLYSKYYLEFSQFKVAISSFIEQAHLTHKQELDFLLTLTSLSFANVSEALQLSREQWFAIWSASMGEEVP